MKGFGGSGASMFPLLPEAPCKVNPALGIFLFLFLLIFLYSEKTKRMSMRMKKLVPATLARHSRCE
jgi:hypothetical protein